MKTLKRILAIGVTAAALVPGIGEAGVLTLSPQATAVTRVEDGPTQVFVRFDLSAVPDVQTTRIDGALLDWPVSGVPSDQESEYAVYPVTASWSGAGVAEGTAPGRAEDPFDTWSYTARDYERNQGGFLRFNLTPLVRDWLTGSVTNYGVVIETEDLGPTGLDAQLGAMQLTIRYGPKDPE